MNKELKVKVSQLFETAKKAEFKRLDALRSYACASFNKEHQFRVFTEEASFDFTTDVFGYTIYLCCESCSSNANLSCQCPSLSLSVLGAPEGERSIVISFYFLDGADNENGFTVNSELPVISINELLRFLRNESGTPYSEFVKAIDRQRKTSKHCHGQTWATV